MKFLPIEMNAQLNVGFRDNPECVPILDVFEAHYRKVGFSKPWIAYFVTNDENEIISFIKIATITIS